MVRSRIFADQLRFHPHSYADPDGRLFWLDGELYRALSQEKTPFFSQLFENGTIANLVSRGLLIQSEPADLALDGYGMVLRHKIIPFVSYPTEWCPAMFKDAAIAYLDLLESLAPRGLTLKDVHPWNLVFDGPCPVFVDITSITPMTARRASPDYGKFCRYYLYPLILMSEGHERIVRHLLPDYDGITESDFSLMTRTGRVARRLRATQWRELFGRLTGPAPILARMRREIEAVRLPVRASEPDELPRELKTFLAKTISELAPRSILGLGAKTTWYSTLADCAAARVVVFDTDSHYLSHLYHVARASNLPVLPVVMDVTDPTPARGVRGHISIAATDRLECDLVLAPALVNPLMSRRHLRFEQALGSVAEFSRRWLIVDMAAGNIAENPISTGLKTFRTVTRLEFDSDSQALVLYEKA
jgi:hypothetical protein